MGPIRKKKNNNAVYNPTLLENWTIARLKAELERKNIAFPINAKRLTLVRILKRYENSDSESITSNTTNARGEEAQGEDTRCEEPINTIMHCHCKTHVLMGKVNSLLQARSNENTRRIVETPNVYVSAPVESVSNLINHNTTNSSQSWSNFNLQSAYNALQNTRTAANAAAESEEQLLNIETHGTW
ncbi:unnamed protein product [Mytilus edulis]|uniref:Uncharacterized protein n=1 Tax=Mytilus edulis TaxID=6550 RepID=A0A8S3RCU7_MYTED|nr:unnamed protein product [Mytilus edulis]